MNEVTEDLAALRDSLLQQMKDGASSWEMPWHNGVEEAFNPATGKIFAGRNSVILWQKSVVEQHAHNHWATLKQWSQLGSRVLAGSKGTQVYHPRLEKGVRVTNPENIQGFRHYHVFNASQVTDYNPDHPDLFSEFEFNPKIEHLVAGSRADIHYQGDGAFYSLAQDKIFIPLRSRFFDSSDRSAEDGFYSTLVHELVHWTGNPKRMNRTFGKTFGDDEYAMEELVAELGAAIICTRFGKSIERRQDHAAYLSSWLRVLNDDFDHFYRAFGLAQEAAEWLYQFTATQRFENQITVQLELYGSQNPPG